MLLSKSDKTVLDGLYLKLIAVKPNTSTRLSSELQHLLDQVINGTNSVQMALPASLQKRLKRLMHQTMATTRATKGWILAGLGLLVLWVWLWQWVLSVAVGLSVMVGVYLAQQQRLKLSWRGWQRLWKRSNRDSTLAVLAGILALGSTYLATAVWMELDQHWLAASVVLEGFGILAILSLLLWQLLHRQFQQQDQGEVHVQGLLADLSDVDSLKRLIAVRQLTQRMVNRDPSNATSLTPEHLAECFRLMLDRETEPLVCSALIESLQRLNPIRQLESSQLAPVQVRATGKAPHLRFSEEYAEE